MVVWEGGSLEPLQNLVWFRLLNQLVGMWKSGNPDASSMEFPSVVPRISKQILLVPLLSCKACWLSPDGRGCVGEVLVLTETHILEVGYMRNRSWKHVRPIHWFWILFFDQILMFLIELQSLKIGRGSLWTNPTWKCVFLNIWNETG